MSRIKGEVGRNGISLSRVVGPLRDNTGGNSPPHLTPVLLVTERSTPDPLSPGRQGRRAPGSPLRVSTVVGPRVKDRPTRPMAAAAVRPSNAFARGACARDSPGTVSARPRPAPASFFRPGSTAASRAAPAARRPRPPATLQLGRGTTTIRRGPPPPPPLGLYRWRAWKPGLALRLGRFLRAQHPSLEHL